MKDQLIIRAKQGKTAAEQMNSLRNELQHLILQELDRKNATEQMCFVGGTALRILFGLDRFSEDLDFSRSLLSKDHFLLNSVIQQVVKSISSYGINCTIGKIKDVKTVQSCFIVFEGLLHPVNRVFAPEQKIAIKVEIDTNPPIGGRETISPVSGALLYKVRHYDLPSLFAGKLHALLFRKYAKGRDYYDFLWYLGKKVVVNRTLLENATIQTEQAKIDYSADHLKQMLKDKFLKTDFAALRKDVEPFLFDFRAADLFTKEIFVSSIDRIDIS